MQLFKRKVVVACLLVLGLSACSSTEDEDLIVADLPEIKAQFKPEVLWSESVGGVGKYFSRIKPNVAYGKVFTASRIGDASAYDVKTGDELWSTDLSDPKNERGFFEKRHSALLNGGPTSGDGKVFYGSENGFLFALEENTGKLLWQSKIKGEIIAAPAVYSNIVVVNSASGELKAFNTDSGEELWKIQQDVPALTLRGISAPTINSGGVIVGDSLGNISVYLVEKGQPSWVAEVGEATGSTELERVIDVDSKPVAYGDKIYAIASRGNLAAIELRSGRILWKRQYSSYRQISVDATTIYLTDVKGHIYAVDRLNGLEKWSQTAFTNRGVTGPVQVGKYIVVGDFEGYLHWLKQDTGEIVARYHVDGSGVYATPTVADDILYVQSRDGDLLAIKTPNE